MRARWLLAALLLALSGAACDRAGEIIPGGATATSTPTVPGTASAAAAANAPITPPAAIEVSHDETTGEEVAVIADAVLAQSVVQVRAIDTRGGAPAVVRDGSGVVVDTERRLILTSYDIVEPFLPTGGHAYTTIGIAVNRALGEDPVLEYRAQIVATDLRAGLAVLRVTGAATGGDSGEVQEVTFDLPAAVIGDSGKLRRNDPLRVFGHQGLAAAGGAGSQAVAVTNAAVVGFRGAPSVEGHAWIKTDALLPYGTAGGPAFDTVGGLVGVVGQLAYDTGVPAAQVRPIALASAVLDAGRSATDGLSVSSLHHPAAIPGTSNAGTTDGVYVEQPLFAENAVEEGAVRDLFDYTVTFDSDATELNYEFAAQGIAEGSQVQELWYLDGVVQDELSSTYTWTLGDFAIVSDRLSSANPLGLPDGAWRLEVWVNGTIRASSTAYMGVAPPEPAVSAFRFASQATATQAPGVGAFSGAEQLLAFFDYRGAAAVSEVRWIVFRDGAVVYQSPAIPWPGGDSGTWWVGFGNGEQVQPGAWEFEIYLDNQVVGKGSVQLF
jgi:hypothetical protein